MSLPLRLWPGQIHAYLGAVTSVVRDRPRPLSVTFILTNRCNFRCVYCNIPAAAGEELTTAELRTAIEVLRAEGMIRASFSGGEALLRPDAAEIIEHARSLGLSTSLNTNGWLTERQIDRLAGCLDMLMVSVDGPAALHDEVRRRKGSHERAMATLDRARAAGVATTAICVLGPWNLGAIADVLALAERHDFWVYFQPAYDDCFSRDRGLHPVFEGDVLTTVAEQLACAKDRGARVGASRAFLDRLRKTPHFGQCSDCHAGRHFATVLADGRVVPCHLTSSGAYLDGRQVGWARAFYEMPRPDAGTGCAISPYQETDIILGLDPRAIADALVRLRVVGRST